MLKKFSLLISLISCLPLLASETYSPYGPVLTEVPLFTINGWKDHIYNPADLDALPENVAIDTLKKDIEYVEKYYPRNNIQVTIPWDSPALKVIPTLKKAGLKHFASTNESTLFIFKNKSPMHDPNTALVGAHTVVMTADEEVLLEHEKSKFGRIDLPCGAVERGEFTHIGAAREVEEETGLNINPDKLRLFAALNRVNYNKIYRNDLINWFYVVGSDGVSGEIQAEEAEVERIFYASLEDLASKEEVEGLKISPLHQKLFRHLYNKQTDARRESMPDERQFFDTVVINGQKTLQFRPREKQDLNDLMYLELLGR